MTSLQIMQVTSYLDDSQTKYAYLNIYIYSDSICIVGLINGFFNIIMMYLMWGNKGKQLNNAACIQCFIFSYIS